MSNVPPFQNLCIRSWKLQQSTHSEQSRSRHSDKIVQKILVIILGDSGVQLMDTCTHMKQKIKERFGQLFSDKGSVVLLFSVVLLWISVNPG